MKYIILGLTCAVALNASIATAKDFYEKGEYEKSLAELQNSKDQYGDAKLHLLWGKAALELGHKEEAMSAYERVLILDPDNQEAKSSLYALYKSTNRDLLAKALQGGEQKSKSTTSLQATLSGGYDTNINYSATGSMLDEYYGFNTSYDEHATLFSRLSADGGYSYDFGSDGGYYVRADLNLYYQNNADAHYYDMLIVGGDVALGYAGDNYSFYLPVNYSKVEYLDTDMFSIASIQPHLRYNISKELIAEANLKYLIRKYNSLYEKMDDSSLGMGAKLYYLLERDAAYFSFEYEDFTADNELNIPYIDKTFLTLNLGYIHTFSESLNAKLDYRFRGAEYEDPYDTTSLFSTKKRSDKYNQAEVTLTYAFDKNVHLFASQRYVKNSSNYVPARYTKNISMFGLDIRY